MIFISYYPTYEELDTVIQKYNPKRVNIFVDLKNCLTGMYMEDAVKTMLLASADSKQPPVDIYNSWLDFIKFHYNYMYQRTINLHMFTIADTGDSSYHKGIYKEYKCRRSITSFKTLSVMEADAMKNIIKKNIEVILKTSKKLYNCYGTYLSHLESDFCAHYYIKNHFSKDDTLNIIYSSDSDMFQTLQFPNTVQFYRKNKDNKHWLDQNNWTTKYDTDATIKIDNYVYMKSITGDAGDDIPGVKGIGSKTITKYVEDICIHDLNHMKSYLEEQSKKNTKDKKLQKIIENWKDVERNYKLISFEELIKNLPTFSYEQLESALDKTNSLDFAESVSFLNSMKERLG